MSTVKTTLDRFYEVAANIARGETDYNFFYCREEGKFYLYERGVWREIFDIELLHIISELTPFKWVCNYPIPARKQISENLKLLVQKPLADLNVNGYLNFPTCLYDVSGNNAFAHDKS